MFENKNIETTLYETSFGHGLYVLKNEEHQATSGPSYPTFNSIEKILNRSLAYLKDAFLYLYNSYELNQELKSRKVSLKRVLSKKQKENKEQTLWDTFTTGHTALTFLNRTKRFDSSLLSSSDVKEYAEVLKKEDLTIIEDGLNPKKLVKPSEVIKKEEGKELVLYPFVFPGKGKWSYDHIVLIAVDFKKQEIIYYDSQGLSSDDPSRLDIFEQDKKFNLREDLEILGESLFKDKFSIKENKIKQQKDPNNCGVFVLSMMDSLSKGDTFEAAIDKCSKTRVSSLRNNLGSNYIDYYCNLKKNNNDN
jgi:hypothetical protein